MLIGLTRADRLKAALGGGSWPGGTTRQVPRIVDTGPDPSEAKARIHATVDAANLRGDRIQQIQKQQAIDKKKTFKWLIIGGATLVLGGLVWWGFRAA